MTESSTAEHSAAPRRTRGAPRWQLRDLDAFATRWGTSTAVIRAAMRHAGKTDVGDPSEAEKIVADYRKLDIRELEQAQTDRIHGAKPKRRSR